MSSARFASPTDVFNGNVDAFTIGINGANTTFNFEPVAATPLPAALPLFAGGLGVIGKPLLPQPHNQNT